jgi:hypothetical protein
VVNGIFANSSSHDGAPNTANAERKISANTPPIKGKDFEQKQTKETKKRKDFLRKKQHSGVVLAKSIA